MRRPALLCTLLFALLTTACGGSGGRASESGSVPAKGPTSVAISTERTGAGSAAVITRAEGGSVAVDLADGDHATLEIPALALETDTLVTLVPLRVAGGVGVAIEPAGLWLDHAARLRFSRADRAVLVRDAPARDADRFTLIDARSTTAIIRFRPVLVVDTIPTGLTPPAAGPLPGASTETEPGVYAFPADPRPNDSDAIDSLAEELERSVDRDGATDAPGASRSAAVRRAAATAATEQAAKCDDRTSGASSRVADTAQTAGSVGAAAPKPTCVKRVIQLVARLEGEFASGGVSVAVLSVVEGHGTFVATTAPTDLSFPLEGAEDGAAELTSLGGGAMESAFGMLGGVATPPPNTESCTSSPLTDGRVTGTATLRDGDTIDLVLQPSGTFTITCAKWGPFSHEPLVWATLTGGGLELPITTSIPDGRNVVQLLGQIVQTEEVRTHASSNGTVTIQQDGSTISISLSIGVFWSRADRCDLTPEERAKGPEYEREVCGAPGS